MRMVYNPKVVPGIGRPARPAPSFTKTDEVATKKAPQVISEIIEESANEPASPETPAAESDKKGGDKKSKSGSGKKKSDKREKQKAITPQEDEEGVSDVVATNQGNLSTFACFFGAPLISFLAKIETIEQIESDYAFGKKLGEGATAVVKLAESKGKKVAVKIVDKESDDWDEENISAFRTEVHILSLLSECPFLISSIDLRETQVWFILAHIRCRIRLLPHLDSHLHHILYYLL